MSVLPSPTRHALLACLATGSALAATPLPLAQIEDNPGWPGVLFCSAASAIVAASLTRWWLRRQEALRHPAPPLPFFELDLSGVDNALRTLRNQGVHALSAHLDEHTTLPAELRKLVRVRSASPEAHALAGSADLRALEAWYQTTEDSPWGELFRSLLFMLWDGRESHQEEITFHGSIGEQLTWYTRCSCELRDGKPDPARCILLGVDLTLARSSARMSFSGADVVRDIYSHANILLWWARVELRNGRFHWRIFLPQYSDQSPIFKLTKGTEKGGLWDMASLPDAPAMDSLAEEMMLNGSPGYQQEFRVPSADGTHWIHEDVLIQKQTPNTWRVIGMSTDVTNRKTVEAAFLAEKERLSVTLSAMREAVVNVDNQGRIQFMNPAAGELSGWSAADATGRPFSEIIPLRSAEHPTPLYEALLETAGQAATRVLPHDATLLRRNGQVLPVEGCLVVLRDRDGRPTGAVAVLRDVADERHVGEQLLRAERMEAIGILAGGLASDFNNLLTSIVGNLNLLEMRPAPAEADQSIREALAASIRARELTQKLLTLAKGGEPRLQPVRLRPLLENAASHEFSSSRILCNVQEDPDTPLALVDPDQIMQALRSLLARSAQLMPQGGTVRIHLSRHGIAPSQHTRLDPGLYLRLSYSDSSPAVAPEQLPKLFNPYDDTHADYRGLGLAVAHSIVSRHGGLIEAHAEPDSGAIFILLLPAVKPDTPTPPPTPVAMAQEPAPLATAPTHASPPAAPAAPASKRLLLMDDEQAIQKVASRMIMRMGFQVDTSSDGAEAVAKYRASLAEGRPYDLVMMDLTVPGGMGGKEAMVLMRKLDPNVRAVVSSGYSDESAMAEYQELGFVGMVAKPYQVSELTAALKDCLTKPLPGRA
jgi:PAS domain S-box-containing protein